MLDDVMDPLLVVLDIDETLVHACRRRVGRRPDFWVSSYAVHKRPFVDEFLAHVMDNYQVALWTSSSPGYAHPLVKKLVSEPERLEFVWCSDRCTVRRDPATREYYWSKKLAKLKRLGFALERIVVVDDSPEKHRQNYGNLIRIEPYEGDPTDRELLRLIPYLQELAEEPNVRRLEKRGWHTKFDAPRELPRSRFSFFSSLFPFSFSSSSSSTSC